MKKSICWLRALACLLITNSHMGFLYPKGFEALGFGGYMGDCMFFVISGYCLYDCTKDSFLRFSVKRLCRVYLPYLIFLPFSLIARGNVGGWSEAFFPIIVYHFVPTILVLYPLLYLCVYVRRKIGLSFLCQFMMVFAVQIMYYFLVYDFSYPVTQTFHLLSVMSYFQMMLLGASLREEWWNGKFWPALLTAVISFGLYVCQAFRPLTGYASILQLYLGLIFAVSVVTAGLELEGRLMVPSAVKLLGAMTLEMYLVQCIIIDAFQSVNFPCGIVMCWISVFAVAYCLYFVSAWIRRQIPLPENPKRPSLHG